MRKKQMGKYEAIVYIIILAIIGFFVAAIFLPESLSSFINYFITIIGLIFAVGIISYIIINVNINKI